MWQKINKSKFSIILAVISVLFLVATLLKPDENVVGINLLRFTFSLLVLSAVFVSTGTQWRRLAIGLLIAVWLVLSWTNPSLPHGGYNPTADLLLIVILAYMAVLLIKFAVIAEQITLDTVNAAIAAYLILALAWAVSFQLLDTLAAGSFTTELAGNFSTALYFSLATVTTLGYGDVTPVAPFARIWAVLEAVVGLLYVAVLIARLVADFRR
ncbi:MAG: potassium channel family protein [Gammaproteobacteria bacterium]|jgi:hypothetical protein